MTAVTRGYSDEFVNYCFRMGKLEADKVFWKRLLNWRDNYVEIERRDTERDYGPVDMDDYEE